MKLNGKVWLQHEPNILMEQQKERIKSKGKPIGCPNCKNKKEKI